MLNAVEKLIDKAVAGLQKVTNLPADALRAGVEDIRLGAARVALEAQEAERRKVSFDEAVLDRERFPLLHRVHNFFEDLPHRELPDEVLAFVRPLIDAPSMELIKDLFDEVVAFAQQESAVPEHALARFAIFEATYITTAVNNWPARPHLARLGIEDPDVLRIANSELSAFLTLGRSKGPFQADELIGALAAATQLHLDAHFEQAKAAYNSFSEELKTFYDARSALEVAVQDADALDALLVRNAAGCGPRGQRLPLEILAADHALLFPERPTPKERNRLDQRLGRQRRQLAAPGAMAALLDGSAEAPRFARRRPALIDFLTAKKGS
jgi:hypothetical protein